MTKISFYILRTTNPLDRQLFACRLAEKAYLQGHQVLIHTESQSQSEAMDKALWAFRSDSFVPHQLLTAGDSIEAPVLITHETAAPPKLMNVLINLNAVQPLFFSQFERLAEIIDDDEEIKKQGRVRFQFYKDRGYPLTTFPINN